MSDSELEAAFALAWRIAVQESDDATADYLNQHEPQSEYEFTVTRHWKFDFAWPAFMLAVEMDGGGWSKFGGRHNSDEDRTKCNVAQLLGWKVLRISDSMIKADPEAMVQQVIRHLLCQAPEIPERPVNYDGKQTRRRKRKS